LLGRLVRSDDTVLDVGTGSGVLAISAVRRGARSAHGTDINPASLGIVALNAGFNGVDGRVTVGMEPLDDLVGPYSIVVANILAPVLIDLADHLVRLTGRTLVISGLLADRYEHVVAALAPLHITAIEHVDGWVAIALER
jgi:ribosomal protein L11 methyltransferase